MSFPEYHQIADDHLAFTILLHPIGSKIKKDDFQQVQDKLSKRRYIPLPNISRKMAIQFKHMYPRENNDWGDYQYHRKALGLICVARIDEDSEIEEAEKFYMDFKEQYECSLIDSRLILIGLKTTPKLEPETTEPLIIDPNHYERDEKLRKTSEQSPSQETLLKFTESVRTQVLLYSDMEEALKLIENDLNYLCQSLFFVLESKRLNLAKITAKSSIILETPCERAIIQEFGEQEIKVKPSKNMFYGRLRKHVGDICLLVNLFYEAYTNYQAAQELLKLAGDDMWLAAAYEGIAVTTAFLLRQQRVNEHLIVENSGTGMRRNYSFNNISPDLSSKRKSQKQENHLTSMINNFNGLDLASPSAKPKLQIVEEDVVVYYRDAVQHYAKFATLSVIEMEAALKAARLCIEERLKSDAANFLNHVAYIQLDAFTYKEKSQRYDVLGDLYNKLKYHRKASFFKRIAAMHTVNQDSITNPNWHQCIKLLLASFTGFKLSLDSKLYTQEKNQGWRGVQTKVLIELAYAARKAEQNLLATRLYCLCLEKMHADMSRYEVEEVVRLLTELSNDTPDIHQMCYYNDLLIPPVTFTSFPQLRKFDVIRLAPHIEPSKVSCSNLLKTPAVSSVFIYSPLTKREPIRNTSTTQYDFCWENGSPGSVDIYLHNHLPIELNIEDFSLITEGITYQYFPSSHSLPANSGPNAMRIVGMPQNSGTLKIIGYAMNIFGVHNQCLFTELSTYPRIKPFIVDVSPALPLLHITTSLPKSPYIVSGGDSEVLTSAMWQLYAGERRSFELLLENKSSLQVDTLNVEIYSNKCPDIIDTFLECVLEAESLPIEPNSQIKLNVTTPGRTRLEDVPINAKLTNETSHSQTKRTSALIEASLRISYTGHDPEQQKYRRHCIIQLDAVLAPCIEITYNDVEAAPDVCILTLGIINTSNLTLHVRSTNEIIPLKPMQSARVKAHTPKCKMGYTTEEIVEHIHENTHIKWKSSGSHQGQINIRGLSWTEDQLRRFKCKPLEVQVSFLDDSIKVGQPFSVKFHIENLSLETYSNVGVTPILTQQSEPDRRHLPVNNTYVLLGTSHRVITEVEPRSKHHIEVSLVSLYPGSYIMNCQCTNSHDYLSEELTCSKFSVT